MPISILSLEQMRAWERATWATGQTEIEVIRRVGQHLAHRARQLTRPGDLILILAGKGHNGDDARAAQAFLNDRPVKRLELLHPERDLLPLKACLAEKPALIMDGLFGIGLNRPLAGAWQELIAAINAAKIPVLAVDIPSGLNADTGETFGAAIEASVTLTVGAPKAGLLAPAAWPFVGRLEVAADVGLIPCPAQSYSTPPSHEPERRHVAGFEPPPAQSRQNAGAPSGSGVHSANLGWENSHPTSGAGEGGVSPGDGRTSQPPSGHREMRSALNWTLPEDFAAFPPPRPVAGHKGSFGHVAIIAGSLGFHGAAVLATRGAQRAQPGLTTLFTSEPVYVPVATQLQSAMVKVWPPEISLPANTSAALIGPGLAAPEMTGELKAFAGQLWRTAAFPVIADASALDWLEPSPTTPTTPAVRVLTPHPGEAARLLQTTTAAVQADRVAAVRQLSQRLGGAWVVLKGHQTLIGRSEGAVFVNSSGNPHLAQGGSGDLLAGFIAGLLAQPALLADVEKTLRFAVWQHGAAADELQAARANWTIEDLANELGAMR